MKARLLAINQIEMVLFCVHLNVYRESLKSEQKVKSVFYDK